MDLPLGTLVDRSAFAPVFEPFRGRKVGYMPMPGNVGDRLIDEAAFQLMRHFEVLYVVINDPGTIPADVEELLVAGGGNMGSFYKDPIALRRRLLADGRPVTVLPQSYTGPEEGAYRRVFVRERASLAYCPGATLAPDLALGLRRLPFAEPTAGAGLWLRADPERRFGRVRCLGDPAGICATPAEYLALAGRHESITTDRLHFAIAGLLCGRKVTLLPNNYHKNRAVWEAWLGPLGCRWADAPPPSPKLPPAHVIYCAELPERRDACAAHLDERGITPHWWRGFHGETWGLTSSKLFPDSGRPPSPGHCGLILSHYALWQHLLASGAEEAIVLEDDAVISPHFAEFAGAAIRALPPTAGLLLLGHLGLRPQDIDARLPGNLARCNHAPFGTHCYYLRHSALPVLLDRMAELRTHVDVQLRENVLHKGLVEWYACLPSLAPQRSYAKEWPTSLAYD